MNRRLGQEKKSKIPRLKIDEGLYKEQVILHFMG
jgi:hypothetical protein